MKKQLLSFGIALLSVAGAVAANSTLVVGGVEMNMDTTFHAKIGPGTTQTSLHLTGPNTLNVFYLTIDKTTPGVSIRSVVGDKLAGNMKTSTMAERNSNDKQQYFAGANGDFFWTSGNASNGSSQVGTPTNAAIVDGEVYKSSNSSYQFTVDAEGIARICRLNFYNGMATCGDRKAELHGINVMSPNNSLTLYTPRFWGSSNQGEYEGSCAEVTCRLVEGESFTAGTTFKVEVTSEPIYNGDTTIPADGFVLFGRGSSKGKGNVGAKDFVAGLHTGDIVELDNAIFTPDGERIYPTQCVSGNPKNVGGGLKLDTEGERGDAVDRHPRTGIGISADGNKIIMMVVDGRGVSVGVTTGMLADIMMHAGAAEALNLDGGGSSTLYTRALGIRNRPSDGQERAVGNGIFAAVEGDVTNQEVAELAFMDWRLDAPKNGMYVPRIYAFNATGVMISDDFKDFTLSCPAELGTISEDGKTFFVTGSGKGLLTATAGTASVSLPVYVADSEILPRLESVIVDGVEPYAIELQAVVNGNYVPVSPAAYSWESSDTEVATVSDDGIVTILKDGEATMTGCLDGKELSVKILAQLPPADRVPVCADLGSWSVSKTSVSTVNTAILENGLALDYTMSSTLRNAKIGLSCKQALYSRPDGICIRAENYTVKPTSLQMIVVSASATQPTTLTFTEIGDDRTEWNFRFEELYDMHDSATYPIAFNSLSIMPGDAAKAEGHIDLPAIEAVYDHGEAGIENVTAADAAQGPAQWFNLQGISVDPRTMAPGLYLRRQGSSTAKVVVR